MKQIITIGFLLPFTLCAEMVKQSDLDPAPIVSIGLYKNGLAVVTRKISPDPNGIARVDGAARPAYGTFWHTATEPVNVTADTVDLLRDTDETVAVTDWAQTYAGREVTVFFRIAASLNNTLALAGKSGGMRIKTFFLGAADDTVAELDGKVATLQAERKPPAAPTRTYAFRENVPSSPGGLPLTLRLASGSTVVIPENAVIAVKAKDGIAYGIERGAPIWRFEGTKAPFAVQYLTEGAAWTPAYRLDLADEKKGRVTMTADIHNAIMDWKDVEVALISGFPNLLYAGVPSLMGWGMNFELYRNAINAAENADPWNLGASRMRNGVMSQSVMMNYAPPSDAGISPAAYAVTENGAGADVHRRPIGKLSLAKGSTCTVPLGTAESEIKRIVDWDVVDTRDEYGRTRRNENEKEGPILWDAVRFTNPFTFPMTTAPIEVTEAGQILGQAKSTWTNPGDTTLVRITKALSVKGSYSEEGDGKTISSKLGSKELERFDYHDRHYRKEVVTGSFIVQNFRKVPASVVIKKTISGEIVECSIEPKKNQALPPRDWRVNLERVLTWEFDLQPGEKREFKLVYWLWVMI